VAAFLRQGEGSTSFCEQKEAKKLYYAGTAHEATTAPHADCGGIKTLLLWDSA
jgi:hypothetical protein